MARNKSNKGRSPGSSREDDEGGRRHQAGKVGQGKGKADQHQSPTDSGTTPLGGETPGSDSIRGPGGVEGSGGRD